MALAIVSHRRQNLEAWDGVSHSKRLQRRWFEVYIPATSFVPSAGIFNADGKAPFFGNYWKKSKIAMWRSRMDMAKGGNTG